MLEAAEVFDNDFLNVHWFIFPLSSFARSHTLYKNELLKTLLFLILMFVLGNN